MKVLVNNYNGEPIESIENTSYPRKVVCDRCGSELEYEKEDTRIGYLGVTHLDCPLCGEEIMLEGNEQDIFLTKDNIKFPTHFYHFSKETGAKEIPSYRIEEYIRKGIDFLRENKEEFYWYSGTGDSRIFVFRYDGDEMYDIVVAKDFYETEISFSNKDYK